MESWLGRSRSFDHVQVFCETQWRQSVKTRLYKTTPAYFIVLASLVKRKEVKVIEFRRIDLYP